MFGYVLLAACVSALIGAFSFIIIGSNIGIGILAFILLIGASKSILKRSF